ncbi:hypothetical protein E4U28_006560 [Claviceps purpurea]|nr:hypothetical protein E4U28_006560 [Claviceps purpurea]
MKQLSSRGGKSSRAWAVVLDRPRWSVDLTVSSAPQRTCPGTCSERVKQALLGKGPIRIDGVGLGDGPELGRGRDLDVEALVTWAKVVAEGVLSCPTLEAEGQEGGWMERVSGVGPLSVGFPWTVAQKNDAASPRIVLHKDM